MQTSGSPSSSTRRRRQPLGEAPVSRNFTAGPARSAPITSSLTGWRAGLSVSHSERAPAIDELFSFGPHGGSQQFLIGNPDIRLEKSSGVELSVHRTTGPVHVQGSIYYSRFSNFIFQAPTGEIEDNLPVYEYRQGKADYYGFELESDVKFGQALGIDWGGELVTDAVRAKIKSFGPAPEIPPFRVLAGLTGIARPVRRPARGRARLAHNRTAPNETADAGLHDGQCLARLAPVRGQPRADADAPGQQPLRRRRAAQHQRCEGLCAARRPRHPLSARSAFKKGPAEIRLPGRPCPYYATQGSETSSIILSKLILPIKRGGSGRGPNRLWKRARGSGGARG